MGLSPENQPAERPWNTLSFIATPLSSCCQPEESLINSNGGAQREDRPYANAVQLLLVTK